MRVQDHSDPGEWVFQFVVHCRIQNQGSVLAFLLLGVSWCTKLIEWTNIRMLNEYYYIKKFQ